MKDFPPFAPRHQAMPPPRSSAEVPKTETTDDLRSLIRDLEQRRREIVAEIARLKRRLREASKK